MQPSLITAPVIVLCIACSPADSLCFRQWLTIKGNYHLIFWESREGFELDSTRSPAVILFGSTVDAGGLMALGKQWPRARLVVLLEPEQEAQAASWLSRGADDYLISDSFSEVRLIHTVQRLVTHAQLIDRRVATHTAELRQAQEVVKATKRRYGQLIQGLSHDLRTPINAILGSSQLLVAAPQLTAQQQQGMGVIHSSANHLLAVLHGVYGMAEPQAAAQPLLSQPPSQAQIVALAADQPPCRILIVEEDWSSRVLLQTLLAPLGFELQVAINGQEAILLWADWQPHLIWMATALASMDGFETTRRLRSIEQKQLRPETPANLFVATKIIALTARLEGDRPQALAAGCNDLVAKPIKPNVILQKIADHLSIEYAYTTIGKKNTTPLTPRPESAELTDLLYSHALTDMPVDWRRQLYEATVSLDIDTILVLVAALPEKQAPLAKALRARVDEFDFELIFAVVSAALGQTS